MPPFKILEHLSERPYERVDLGLAILFDLTDEEKPEGLDIVSVRKVLRDMEEEGIVVQREMSSQTVVFDPKKREFCIILQDTDFYYTLP